MEQFFGNITKTTYEYTKRFDERDFVHLYGFQKYFLYQAIRRLMELVQIKIHHLWVQKKNIIGWKEQSESNYISILPKTMTTTLHFY